MAIHFRENDETRRFKCLCKDMKAGHGKAKNQTLTALRGITENEPITTQLFERSDSLSHGFRRTYLAHYTEDY
jgi:hypothetical protein